MTSDDALFDGVFSLHHIPGGWRQVVAETARVLKLGGWLVFTDMVVSPRAGRMLGQLPPRFDQLEETALRECLAENGLHLEYHGRGRGVLVRLMGHCAAIARKVQLAVH